MGTKICSRCKRELDSACFSKCCTRPDGLQMHCKECKATYFQNLSEESKRKRKKYAEDRKEELAAYNKEYREKNAKKLQQASKQRYLETREVCIARTKEWAQNNKERRLATMRVYSKNRRETDPLFRLATSVRRRMNKAFAGVSRSKRTQHLLGCTFEALLLYLGPRPYNVDLDHICPLAQARTVEEMEALCHYTNLRWLDSMENRYKKRDYWTKEGAEMCSKLLCRDWIDIDLREELS
jgi:hypothetical protein